MRDLTAAVLGLALVAAAQSGSAKTPASSPVSPVRFDSRGWPIVAGDVPPPAPAGETKPAATATPLPASHLPTAATSRQPTRPPASGLQLASPLHEVYASTRSPAAFRELGGLVVWWRLTIYGTNGEAIGVREITHTLDCAFAKRDRLEHQDGHIYGRVGAQVFAEHRGMPWPTLVEKAEQELALFGMHMRWPWSFGDSSSFVVTRRDVQQRAGERFMHLVIERRPPAAQEVFGPELNPEPRDRFELFCDPSTGQPREMVHRFVNSMQKRRVLLEDWREFGSVRLPYRRIYVDESLRPTTELQILRIVEQRVAARDFRLH